MAGVSTRIPLIVKGSGSVPLSQVLCYKRIDSGRPRFRALLGESCVSAMLQTLLNTRASNGRRFTAMSKERFPALEENYRARATFILGLLTFTFCLGGVVAFVFDSVTLLGRYSAATFNGPWAHVAGVFCFLVAAFWLSEILKIYGVAYARPIPFFIAIVVSAVLLLVVGS